ncbi:hypothetical protein JXJ21_08375 [candidate division KSB1 bacterium]|nr:hypothetical protein [candidate division KSB1 bacterium]
MSVEIIEFCNLKISRLILGGNPFSGFSHQSPQKDQEMVHYFTTARIKQTLKQAERVGITTFLGRADRHIIRVLLEYWDGGGTLQWIAQTCPELCSIERAIDDAIAIGAKAIFIHGGQMDYMMANDQLSEIPKAIDRIRDARLPAGIAGHTTNVFQWAEEALDVDFYMCSYYNPCSHLQSAEGDIVPHETFSPDDRDKMVSLIQHLSKPVIHYKVMAAGRNEPHAALEFVAKHLRAQDAVCIGSFPKNHPDMLLENAKIFSQNLITAR